MNMTLQVRDWDQHYENNRTRGMKHTAWVPVPNKQDNEGYVQLVSHEDGAAHLGAWLALLQIASRCDVRGTLLRKDGRPHTAASLALISRLPAAVFDAVIPRLVDIGWIEILKAEIAQPPAVAPHLPAASVPSADQERKEQKNRGTEHTCASPDGAARGDNSFSLIPKEPDQKRPDHRLAWFDAFWEVYRPLRSRAKKDALKAFMGVVKTEAAFQTVMAALKTQVPEILTREPSFRPYAASWLRGGRWEDEAVEAAQEKPDEAMELMRRMHEARQEQK